MFRIWLKTIKSDKIVLSRIFEFDGAYRTADFYKHLTVMCEKCDIPVPMVLKRHEQHFTRFNILRFKHPDFIESVDFSCLMLEGISDEKPKKP